MPTEPAKGEQAFDTEGGGVLAELPMQLLSSTAQLSQIPEHQRAAPGSRGQDP